MGSRTWTKLVMAAGAAIVAVTTGTAVMAAIDDRGDPPAASRQSGDESSDAGAVAAMCAPGHPDCQDTFVAGEDGFEQCATDAPCGDFDAKCAAGTDCIEPGFTTQAPFCEEGLGYEDCFPAGTPAGWDCLQLESFPVQIKCYPIGCTPVDGPITILPAPDQPVDRPLIDPVDPSLVDPGIAEGEPVPPTTIECEPAVDCSLDPIPDPCLGSPCAISSRPDERCLPPECEVTDDDSIACKVPPPVECAPDEQCVPPDCVISSDDIVSCPIPLPCPQIEGEVSGCSSPGSCGDLGCDSVACPEDISRDECVKILEENRGGSGSGGAIDTSE